ncbi:MAG TPA: phospholipase [Patescibacteria group bacterium]|nr:phospholipase [Patescibacteria group bacterium]
MADTTLSGPSAGPAAGGPAKQLVILLHGVGSDGDDLIALAPYFATRLPDAAFLAPHAPAPFDMAPMGRQWFSLQDRHPQKLLAEARAVAPVLNAFIDGNLAERGLTDNELVLIGFSQGTMMALHVGLRRPKPCAALLGYSGLLIAPDRLPDELTARPRVLLVHGEEDETVVPDFLPLAENALRLVGVPVLSLMCKNLGHSINDEGLIAGIEFAAQGFGL